MKSQLLLAAAALLCAAPICAQPGAAPKTINDSVFRLVTPAQAEALVAGKPLALHLRDVTLEAALLELQKQSGVPLDLSNLPTKALDVPLSVDVETTSFDRAFDAVADEANLKLQLGQFGVSWIRIVTLKAPPGGAFDDGASGGPLAVNGLFTARLLKLDVRHFKSLDWSHSQTPARDGEDGLNVTIESSADPRLPAIGPPRLRVTRADDESGRSLVPPPAKASVPFYFFNSDDPSKQSVAQLLPPQSDARTLAHLEGFILYVTPAASEKWDVPVALDGAWKASHDFKNGGQDVRLSIESVERTGENLEVSLRMDAPKGGDWGALGNPLFSPSEAVRWMHFEDASGAILRPRSSGGGSRGNAMNARVTFYLPYNKPIFPSAKTGRPPQKLALPLKFVFDAPTEFVQTQVPFSFENVPLP